MRPLASLALILFGLVSVPAAVAPLPAVVTIAHFNDVYEIGPVEGGKSGGLARVATELGP